MARKRPTRRKQPFVIEPLNWVAPDDAPEESEKASKQKASDEGDQK